jgi:hypothetical protein
MSLSAFQDRYLGEEIDWQGQNLLIPQRDGIVEKNVL